MNRDTSPGLATSPSPSNSTKAGAIYAVLAYAAWGLFPLYWKLFGTTPAIEVLSHRVIWSLLFLLTLLLSQHRGTELTHLLRSRSALSHLLLTALLLSFNWGLYIYGVNTDRVIETSLGYFINPLVNVLLGFVFLKERLTQSQKVAVLLATVGVSYFIWNFGQVPWIALSLAFSFGFYGLLRKTTPVAPMAGLIIETLLITPLAIACVGYFTLTGTAHFATSWVSVSLFMGAGVVTSLPLLCFTNAARRLKLSTLGFFQYLAPSLQLALGVFLFHEPFTSVHKITFIFIWSALLIYSTTSLLSLHHKPVES
ncbi:MAG: EamA family transporter RarD [Leptolyngbyaceae cyanobacterium bins.59]|nr:EamA family transporter RarD [Leptolyngbyaceae cyanobacterium bins.59]